MTPIEIEETKIICEFLGGEVYEAWKIKDSVTLAWRGEIVKVFRDKFIGAISAQYDKILVDQCKFKTNVEWLWYVVEYIESLDLSEYMYTWENELGKHSNFMSITVDIEYKSCSVILHNQLDPSDWLANFTCDTKLEAVYLSILKFIEWYNKLINQTK